MDYDFSFLLFFFPEVVNLRSSLFNDSGQFFGSWHQSLLRKLLTKYNQTDFKNLLFQMSPVSRSIGANTLVACKQCVSYAIYFHSDQFGETPAMAAARNNHWNVVEFLIIYNSCVTNTSNMFGQTLQSMATLWEAPSSVKKLLQAQL